MSMSVTMSLMVSLTMNFIIYFMPGRPDKNFIIYFMPGRPDNSSSLLDIYFRNLATKPPKLNFHAVQMFILPLFSLFLAYKANVPTFPASPSPCVTDRESIDR
uniref:Uncharacterized protein n=1 Tax=Glossina austeni TaxID=7395 RepID=A0A1A9VRE2_GLOAU